MRNFGLERLLAGTALALVLTAATTPASANPMTPEAIEAAIPLPDAAELKPLTPADVADPAEAKPEEVAAPTAAEPTATPAAAAPAAVTPAEPPRTEQAAAPPAPAVNPVAEKLKELLTAKTDRIFGGRKERAVVDAYYAARDYAPLWVTDGEVGERGRSVATFLGNVAADGLDPADYPVPNLRVTMDADALAEAELRITASALTFARHAELGRVHYSRVASDIFYQQTAPDPAAVLAKLADAKNVAAALDSFNPQNTQYKALKAKLAELRASKGDTTVRIPSGPTLRIAKDKAGKEVWMQDSRVPEIRERLKVAGDPNSETYDRAVADAVAKFQRSRGLTASGQLNAATVDALNGPRRDNVENVIIANLERWRWLPRDLGNTRVILNIPDYSLRVFRGEAVVWQTKVVVGKPATATPLLTETMKYITVNPTWNVPPSIVYGEYLPALQQDPTVMQRMGMRVTQNSDGSVHISQPPGDKNALGRIRFNFPNKFLVYQHDTPDKHLFAHDKRAYSHGCMRVENPAKYAEVLLSLANPRDNYTEARIRSMYGPSEIDIKFQNQIPVHITYQTAFVDDHGKLQLRDDIYGRDSRLLAVLRGDERRMAEVPVSQSQPNYARPPARLPPGVASGGSYASGPSFFEALFGGASRQPPAAIPPQAQQQQRRRVVITR
jgi:murein L,D-transpeptidase YcbB/YkuD